MNKKYILTILRNKLYIEYWWSPEELVSGGFERVLDEEITSEILGLEWSRVDFDRRASWHEAGSTKNGEGRGIPLNRDAAPALKRMGVVTDDATISLR